jgi:hypothetical protein
LAVRDDNAEIGLILPKVFNGFEFSYRFVAEQGDPG